MRPPLVALAIVLGALCIIATVSAIAHQSAFSEYLTQARRCVELNDCPSRGGRTGGLPIFHGAIWIRLIAYSLRAGGDQTPVQSIILGLMIVSVLITFFLLHRYLGLRAAALALGLYFPVVLVPTDITFFTYTNLLPLPFAIYYACVCLLIEFRRPIFGAIAAVALAAAVSAEMGSIVMVPFHLLLVALTVRRPLLAVAIAGLAFAIPFGWESTDAALEIVRQVPTVRFAVGLAISGGIAALGGRFGQQVLLPVSAPVSDRIRAAMIAALIYSIATIWLAGLLLMHGFPNPRYFLPAAFPFLYLVAERMASLGMRPTTAVVALQVISLLLLPFASPGLVFLQVLVVGVVTLYAFSPSVRQTLRGGHQRLPAPSSWPAVVISLCAIGLALADITVRFKRGPTQTFTFAEAERLVATLYSGGYSYAELLGALQGPGADDLMALLTERDPKVFKEPPPHLAEVPFSLLTLKVPNTSIHDSHGVIASVAVDDARSAIVVRGERSYLDWLHMRRCGWITNPGQPASYHCMEPRTDRPVPHNWPYVELGESVPLSDTGRAAQAYDQNVHFEVPVRTPGRGAARIIRTANEWPATWRITAVSGVEFEGELPAVEIRLHDRRQGAGFVVFELAAVVPGDPPWVWVPHVIEVAEENEPLLEPLRGIR